MGDSASDPPALAAVGIEAVAVRAVTSKDGPPPAAPPPLPRQWDERAAYLLRRSLAQGKAGFEPHDAAADADKAERETDLADTMADKHTFVDPFATTERAHSLSVGGELDPGEGRGAPHTVGRGRDDRARRP